MPLSASPPADARKVTSDEANGPEPLVPPLPTPVAVVVTALRNVKVSVTDLAVARDRYGVVFGLVSIMEFPDDGAVVRGIHGEIPGLGAVLALREDPEAARGLGGFAIANFTVPDRSTLEPWVSHLDALGVEHSGIRDTPRSSLLVMLNPDGQAIHLYTPMPG